MTVFLRSGSKPGFTLIELLVALSLAVVLLALIFSGYAIVTRVRSSQVERQGPSDTSRHALRLLADDLERTFFFTEDTNCTFQLRTGADVSNALWELSFCRSAAVPGAADIRWAAVEQVRYRLEEGPATNLTLICCRRPLVGPDARQAPQTNEIFHDLAQLDIRLFDGKKWQEQWPVAGGAKTSGLPRAARIEITAVRGAARATAATEVFIPAANRIESRTKPKEKKDTSLFDAPP